jgi:hypothetical protein
MLGTRDGGTVSKGQVTRRNPVAKSLSRHRHKTIASKKKYDRKYNAAIAYHEMLKFFRKNYDE